MSASEPQRPQRPPLLSPTVLKLAALAFAAGLLLFLLVWLKSRHDYDFYKADGTPAAPGQVDALPAPLPPDLAGNASGLRVVGKDSASDVAAAPTGDQPRLLEAPVRPVAPPPPASQPAPTGSDRAIPQPLNSPAPRYPQEALRMGAGGTVRVRVTVAADGSVDRLELAEGSGNRYLDRAALEAVRRWRFQPATRGGQPTAAEVVVPITFNLGGK
jgi:protein TonB